MILNVRSLKAIYSGVLDGLAVYYFSVSSVFTYLQVVTAFRATRGKGLSRTGVKKCQKLGHIARGK